MALTLQDLEICYSLAREAREIRERMEVLRGMAERCTPAYGLTPRAVGFSDRVADSVAEMEDYFAGREAVAARYLRHVRMVELAIGTLADSEERRVMRLWYLDGLTPTEIMVRMYLSRASVYRRRDTALARLGVTQT